MKDLSMHLLDIAQNSIKAGAKHISFNLKVDGDFLVFRIDDDGSGMESSFLLRVTDPFTTTRTTRKVGLGIPLLKDSSEISGGRFKIFSEVGVGTAVECTFKINHIDRIPIGDISGTIRDIIMANSEIEYVVMFKSILNEFIFSTESIKKQLGEVPINNYEVLQWINEYLDDGIKSVFGGVLDEVIS